MADSLASSSVGFLSLASCWQWFGMPKPSLCHITTFANIVFDTKGCYDAEWVHFLTGLVVTFGQHETKIHDRMVWDKWSIIPIQLTTQQSMIAGMNMLVSAHFLLPNIKRYVQFDGLFDCCFVANQWWHELIFASNNQPPNKTAWYIHLVHS